MGLDVYIQRAQDCVAKIQPMGRVERFSTRMIAA